MNGIRKSSHCRTIFFSPLCWNRHKTACKAVLL